MIESAESFVFITHILCCSWAVCFWAAPSSERQHELGLEHRPGRLHHAVEGRGHPSQHGVSDMTLDVHDRLASIALEPAAVEVLGDRPELDEEVGPNTISARMLPRFSRQSAIVQSRHLP